MAGGYNYIGGGGDIVSIIQIINEVAKDVAKEYGLVGKQVNARMACLLKNQYKLQIVLKIPESQYTMFTMTGELDIIINKINHRISGILGMPRLDFPLEIVWENPAFNSF